MGKINEKQEKFIYAYLKEPNATQAALEAGYSKRTAYSQGQRLLKHVEIKKALIEARKERSERTKIDADWVLLELEKQYKKAEQAEEVPASSLRALDLIGKHVGVQAFRENLNVSGEVSIAERLAQRRKARKANGSE